MSNPYAPSKTIHVPEDVLEVLAHKMAWSSVGHETHAKIEPLDRALYLKTDKVLKDLGGKWNRKAQAHIFQDDPRPGLGLIVENGAYEQAREGFYCTPRSIGIAMAEMADLQPGQAVLEPSAGTGALCEAILEAEPNVVLHVIEIDDDRRAVLREKGYTLVGEDFLQFDGAYDRILQNPPFENLQDIDHLSRAWNCLKPGGILVSVMSEGPFFRNDLKARVFRMWLSGQDTEIVTLSTDAFKESGTTIQTRLVRIKKGAQDE